MHPTISAVTQRIIERSRPYRDDYLRRIDAAAEQDIQRASLSCGNLAHGFAASDRTDKRRLRSLTDSNIAIVSAYNDMLSAHQPYRTFPEIIKAAVGETGGVAQFAGGVPAMCDGVTQGQAGMDLSLMSRDVIALSASVALSHQMFDGMLMLGICDKIVPGLLIAALSFGHLPAVFVPAGPMPSGLPNQEKARVRKRYSAGEANREELLEAEAQSYHSPGTCTFYGTANSNQLIVELMGLHLPGASFVNPGTELRDELTRAAARQVTRLTKVSGQHKPVGRMIDERSLVNGLVGLICTGGSTNHTMHLIAIARAAGIILSWDDFADISSAVPLLTRLYPNGEADINHFHEAGGMAFLTRELLTHGLVHADVDTIAGPGLERYCQTPVLTDGDLTWTDGVRESADPQVLRKVGTPFLDHGGLNILRGNLGISVIKTSSLHAGNLRVKAPAVVFETQEAMLAAYQADELNRDCVVVVRFQGPTARGMPELHKLTPSLSVLQDKGFQVALVTDGRMSGASGNVPAAIHLTPEASHDGLIARIQDGDEIELNAEAGTLILHVAENELNARAPAVADLAPFHEGCGRELFGTMRRQLGRPDSGACSLFDPLPAGEGESP